MSRAVRPLGAGKRAQVAGGVLAVVLMTSAGDAGAGGRKDGVSAPKPTPPQQTTTATPTTPTPTANGEVGGGGTGGRIDRLDGALLAVADTDPPALTTADVKRAAAEREKNRRERAARLPALAASAAKKG
mgnify:FL=1